MTFFSFFKFLNLSRYGFQSLPIGYNFLTGGFFISTEEEELEELLELELLLELEELTLYLFFGGSFFTKGNFGSALLPITCFETTGFETSGFPKS